MKARPTIYNGIQMRSRLEARVAAMLDESGAVWEYEPTAFASGRAQYLPDFRLPDPFSTGVNVYIEVKPRVEDVFSALTAMQVIHKSEPQALLVASCEQLLTHGVLMTRDSDDVMPVFLARCPCGALLVATEGPNVGERTIYTICWRCGDEAIRYPGSKAVLRMAEWGAA